MIEPVNQNTIFRLAKKSDHLKIVEFQIAMALETENLALDTEVCKKGVLAIFENPNKGAYHVIEIENQVVASLLIIPEWSDWRNGTVWWIHSVYLEPALRKNRLFSKFYNYIKSLAEETENIRGLRLYVDKRNEIAQLVYKKIGMTNEHYELYEWMKTF